MSDNLKRTNDSHIYLHCDRQVEVQAPGSGDGPCLLKCEQEKNPNTSCKFDEDQNSASNSHPVHCVDKQAIDSKVFVSDQKGKELMQNPETKSDELTEKGSEEEKKVLDNFIVECREKAIIKNELRQANLAASESRLDDACFATLDSSLKKNTTFIKKLRLLTESQKDSLAKDFAALNLSKYVEEAASAVVEAKLKMSDVQTAVYLCSLIHQRYDSFAPFLLEYFQKCLLSKKDDGKLRNASKYRVDLRLFGELVSVGVLREKEGLSMLASQLQLLVVSSREEHQHLSILASFCRHCGDDYMGLFPRKIRLLAEKYNVDISRSQMLPPERQKACRNLLRDYLASLKKHVEQAHTDLKSMEQHNRKYLQVKGELTQERKDSYETAFAAFQKLFVGTVSLADLMDEDVPELCSKAESTEDGTVHFDIFNPLKDPEFQYAGDTSLFEDDDTRCFYENWPDLRAVVPGILYRESEACGKGIVKEEADKPLEEEQHELGVEEVEKEIETAGIEQVVIGCEMEADVPVSDDIDFSSVLLEPKSEEGSDVGTLMKQQFDAYLLSLPNCVNRDLIDKAAVEFCMNFNTKINRKKLVRALFTVYRTRYDLLPFYARLVATLCPCMPDVAVDLLHCLKGDLKWHMRKKDQINIESKMKTVRFLGELVKFQMCPKNDALQALKMLMFDFSHHNVEMACALLEACGRFLFRSPDSHYRTKVYLEVMMRKKTALTLDSRYDAMVENAYYFCNPPECALLSGVERPPMHMYIRRLLYRDLSKVTTEKVLRQMRKLNWDEPEIAFYAAKCLTAVWNVRFNAIHCAANLLAGIASYHEHVAIQVVDGVLEGIRLGMEVNHPSFNQRRVSCIKYLGELYNYRMVESVVVFRVLYSFITFGVSLDVGNPHPLDPPEHLFRLQAVCILLNSCGQYFDKGSSRKKLDCFLTFFERYYWFKRSLPVWDELRPFPIDVTNMVHDAIEVVRPKLRLCSSFEEAQAAAVELEQECRSKIDVVLVQMEGNDAAGVEVYEGLCSIEDNEDEDGGTVESDRSQEDDELSVPRIGEAEDEAVDGAVGENGENDFEDDFDTTDSAGEDADKKVKFLSKCQPVPCVEDDDFVAEFNRMVAENTQVRSQESVKVTQLDIAVPMHLRGMAKKHSPVCPDVGSSVSAAPAEMDTVSFILLTKRGNKQQLASLDVPVTASFATKVREREEAERMERLKMKQMVLNIHERQEEEDYQEMMASFNRVPPSIANRERRVCYHHPKGAPDADLIFGSGPK